ncbi:YqcI/YcgG family protein [Millisia brevis]|uniref:YqcI/YcgG family protein n=1 Tax=Millisia brevis TaxID=264148 RepID=UPI000AE9C956|nr:YqcI/YcgG family protein [Millisia brevis]
MGTLPTWGADRVIELERLLLDREDLFPCTFAVSATRKGSLRYGFVEDLHDESTWEPLHLILRDYLENFRSLARDTSLVVFFGGVMDGFAEDFFFRRFWQILQYLHDNDRERWPADLPMDADDPLWEFAYGGEEIFVVCNTPAHGIRRSRHNPEFMITFQPRWVFEGLEPDSARGIAARRAIRTRLRAFDGSQPSAVLGNFGDPENREWLQYFIPDDESAVPALKAAGCPFRPQLDHRRVAAAPAPGGWRVVVNGHGHRSVWSSRRALPLGWTSVGIDGSREDCLQVIRQTWTGLQPNGIGRTAR